MGANCIMIQWPRHAGRSSAVSTLTSCCGGEFKKRKRPDARESGCRWEIENHVWKTFASHLALSLPCDLMKFMSLYLDRKATSWLLVLKWKETAQFWLGDIWWDLAAGGTLTFHYSRCCWLTVEIKAAFAGCWKREISLKGHFTSNLNIFFLWPVGPAYLTASFWLKMLHLEVIQSK